MKFIEKDFNLILSQKPEAEKGEVFCPRSFSKSVVDV